MFVCNVGFAIVLVNFHVSAFGAHHKVALPFACVGSIMGRYTGFESGVTIKVQDMLDAGPGGWRSAGTCFKPIGSRHRHYPMTVSLSREEVILMDQKIQFLIKLLRYTTTKIPNGEVYDGWYAIDDVAVAMREKFPLMRPTGVIEAVMADTVLSTSAKHLNHFKLDDTCQLVRVREVGRPGFAPYKVSVRLDISHRGSTDFCLTASSNRISWNAKKQQCSFIAAASS